MRSALLEHVGRLTDDDLPAYVYDLPELREHLHAIRTALPKRVELLYAAKANSDPRILRTLAEHVDGFEVASGGELSHVRGLVPDAPIAFGGPGKTEKELARALDAGVQRLHIESEQELRLVTALLGHRTVDVLLRVNLPVVVGRVALAMGGHPSPFGMDPAQLDRCLEVFASAPRLRLRGLHFHLASGLEERPHLALIDEILTWAEDWAHHRAVDLTEVNVGGGMGVDYTHPRRKFDWRAFGAGLRPLLARHPRLTLRIEPGRSVTAYCGWYVTQVLDIKFSRGHAFAVLRGGTHHLRTPAAKQHDQPFEVIPDGRWARPWQRPEARDEPVTLVGQLCTPKDVLARGAMVERLRVGDRVAFAMAGAYAWNISHHAFLMHPHPTFHHVDDAESPASGGYAHQPS
ncbi:diaminopimelate decarboxylase [Streptomyces sp. Ag109_O5-1]|uniref:type III PLP-dependent enzyme n=1 Tax=Streptomyces sp. Ag109_O5-1 TaxID=1938851 RepID=UPI000F4D3600|nr:type III PLP-dependent enzyme [Streptomyces sp. Ag109_O5-1]RPE46068.1 diaminopimelate decarboxylase [Streptomyces sp. Ag109_O5-1]